MLIDLYHIDEKKEHIAIVLKTLKNWKIELILSMTQLADNGTAQTETEAYRKQLSMYHFENNKIFVFFDLILHPSIQV